MTVDARLLELGRGTRLEGVPLGLISSVDDDGIIWAECRSLAQEILSGKSACA